jgi:hypothetical protein
MNKYQKSNGLGWDEGAGGEMRMYLLTIVVITTIIDRETWRRP